MNSSVYLEWKFEDENISFLSYHCLKDVGLLKYIRRGVECPSSLLNIYLWSKYLIPLDRKDDRTDLEI